ncbi:dTMP kinase [Candidatus Nitrosotenuis uzonensis]|uniref:Probable thymidylate kinase n=1 Tax=Candidatus Nitrosotenuis uzonensis TaxID=1407055 RepID=V6AQG7_9ARCH|nr:thymidylate kinase [Candidatus Nitrosotenuis uzonensis]CDI04981.1 Thymidylate kinase [Candidatus Nitrosotenuis uzonensis]
MREKNNETVRWYGKGIPYLENINHKGKLIVIEGPDSSGRSTQISLLTAKLEADGHAVINTGLKRSELVGEGILEAKRNAALGKKTLALFYAADFADQLEQKIIPSLEAGYIVLADRYIYTLMARNTVRGIPRKWSHDLYGFALVPDLVYYLKVDPYTLVHRVFEKNSSLDYYESGSDMGLSDDMFESFIIYQQKIAKEFQTMQKTYGLVPIEGDHTAEEINADLKKRVDTFLRTKR